MRTKLDKDTDDIEASKLINYPLTIELTDEILIAKNRFVSTAFLIARIFDDMHDYYVHSEHLEHKVFLE